MGKRYITNDTAGPIFVGGTLVQPGEGREVDEAFLPPATPARPPGRFSAQRAHAPGR